MQQTNNLLTQETPTWKLRLGEYIAHNIESWRRFGMFTLFFIDIIVIGVLAYVFINYVSGLPRQVSLEEELAGPSSIDFNGYHARNRVSPLRIERIQAIRVNEYEYDFIAILSNPNTRWMAMNTVIQFRVGGVAYPEFSTFVLPRQQRAVALFRQRVTGPSPLLTANLQATKWRRIKRDLVTLSELQGRDYVYTSLPHSSTNLDFTLTNSSPYSYWEAPFLLIAWQNDTIVGVQSSSVPQLLSGQDRTVALAWRYTLPLVTKTTIDFQIDVTDPAHFMDPPSTLVSPF